MNLRREDNITLIARTKVFPLPFKPKGARLNSKSPASHTKAVNHLSSLRQFTGSFVDDVAVHSHQWREHLDHLDRFLAVVKKYGLTLNLKKCRFAQSQVRFCGEIIGSGKRFTDPEKLQVVQEMKPPITKTEVKRILGFFSYLREHIKDFANVAHPRTDLTSKKYSGKSLGESCSNKVLKS